MNIAQLEHADTFNDPSPATDARDRLEQLFHARRGAIITVDTKRIQISRFDHKFADTEAQYADYRSELSNLLTQAELRLVEINNQIDETILSAAEDIKAARALAEVVTV
jgi:uncharacterized protein YhaN